MSSEYFNFNQLRNVYFDALHSPDKSFAFDITIGKGQFLFMMFLGSTDKDAKDKLFIYMRNTKVLREVKLYGNHKNGDFKMYLTDELKIYFVNELQLKHNSGRFSFRHFLIELNSSIPLKIDNNIKLKKYKENKKIIRSLNVIDEPEKTVLIGPKKVHNGHPRERTLRKLYLYVDADYKVIYEYIEILKLQNKTIAWTTPDKRKESADIMILLQEEKISS